MKVTFSTYYKKLLKICLIPSSQKPVRFPVPKWIFVNVICVF